MTTRKKAPVDSPPDGDDQAAAAARESRSSVYEAIGKLIGDDAARDRGSAEKEAAASDIRKSSRKSPQKSSRS